MALILYFLLAMIGVFALIASGPLIAAAYHDAADEIAAGKWRSAISVAIRALFWLVAVLLTLWLTLIGGMFGIF